MHGIVRALDTTVEEETGYSTLQKEEDVKAFNDSYQAVVGAIRMLRRQVEESAFHYTAHGECALLGIIRGLLRTRRIAHNAGIHQSSLCDAYSEVGQELTALGAAACDPRVSLWGQILTRRGNYHRVELAIPQEHLITRE